MGMASVLRARSSLAALVLALALLLGGVFLRHIDKASAAVACTITGTPGPDTINGTAGADVICGLGGDDVINGLGGTDIIDGGPGADDINGGPSNNDRVVYEDRTSGVTITLAAGADDGSAQVH